MGSAHGVLPQLHLAAARHLGVRPPSGKDDHTVDLQFAEYITSFKRYLYSQAWIDRLVAQLSTAAGFEEATGKEPLPVARQPEDLPPAPT
jgi:hypothetical protein